METGAWLDPEASAFERARRETVRYHEELYASAALGQAGTWLAKPHPLLLDALDRVPGGRPVVAYDLGAGIGRHTIPMLRWLPAGSAVYAVDLLPSALHALRGAVPPGLPTVLRTSQADLDDFAFPVPADLVLAFSAIEHLPGRTAIRRLLERVHTAVSPGGVVAIGIFADRREIDGAGNQRPGLLESAISTAEAEELLGRVFADYTVAYRKARPSKIRENREGQGYTLASTLVSWLGTAPAGAELTSSLVPARTCGQSPRECCMFARVITAQAGAEGFDQAVRLAEQQLPGASQLPGFSGYYFLTDAETGKLLIISLWETREQMDAVTAGSGPSGIREERNPATAGFTAQRLDTYEVALHT